MRYHLLSLPALFALVIGCSDSAPGGAGAIVRVVDGVTVVDNPGLYLADSTAWRFDSIPSATIGVVDGPAEYVFGRIGGLLLRPDGTIMVADAQARELRIYDRGGQFLSRVGGAGEGPGEFTGISQLRRLVGDSIAVLNGREGSQIDILSPDLSYARRFRPRLAEMTAQPPYSSDMLLDIFANADPLMGDYIGVCAMGAGTVCSDSIRFFRTDDAGGVLARFGRHVFDRAVRVRLPETNAVWTYPHPQPIWAVGPDRFYYTDAKRFEIKVYTADGALERVIRVAGVPERWPVDAVFPEYTPPDDPRMAAIFAGMRNAQLQSPLPDTFPAFSDIAVDHSGYIWALEYVPTSRAEAMRPRWYVFDPDGHLRYAVRSPLGLGRKWGLRRFTWVTQSRDRRRSYRP